MEVVSYIKRMPTLYSPPEESARVYLLDTVTDSAVRIKFPTDPLMTSSMLNYILGDYWSSAVVWSNARVNMVLCWSQSTTTFLLIAVDHLMRIIDIYNDWSIDWKSLRLFVLLIQLRHSPLTIADGS